MGMYTELVMATEIKNDPNIISVLQFMLGDTDSIKPHFTIPEHPLFKTERWKSMLCCDSYYFAGTTHCELECDNLGSGCKLCYLTIRTNFKNYDSEIDHFLDWLSPYIVTNGFLGYERYEEFENPTLIYNNNGKIEYRKVQEYDSIL